MTNPFSSVRWKVLLAFFLIIGLSFLIMAGMLTNMLGRYLFEQRIRADRAGLEKWAVQAAPFLYAADTQTLTQTLAQAGDELSGRVLLLDGDGKVQLDSFREAHGRRLEYPEVVSILLSGQTADYGVHSLKTGRQARSDSSLSVSASFARGKGSSARSRIPCTFASATP